jgi:hypothetical protein
MRAGAKKSGDAPRKNSNLKPISPLAPTDLCD